MGASASHPSPDRPPSRALHVLRVIPGSPAALAGIQVFFDFIVGINGGNHPKGAIDVHSLEEVVESHEGQSLELLVWSSKARLIRVVPITPSRQWALEGTSAQHQNGNADHRPSLLGLSMRVCEPETALDHVWHILEILEGSPAESAGLVPFGDWVVGWSGGVLSKENDFYDVVEQHVEKPLRVYVYSYDFDTLREVVLVPNRMWGGEGLLGCGVGYGLLHRIPEVKSEPEIELSDEDAFDEHEHGEFKEEQLFVPADVYPEYDVSNPANGQSSHHQEHDHGHDQHRQNHSHDLDRNHHDHDHEHDHHDHHDHHNHHDSPNHSDHSNHHDHNHDHHNHNHGHDHQHTAHSQPSGDERQGNPAPAQNQNGKYAEQATPTTRSYPPLSAPQPIPASAVPPPVVMAATLNSPPPSSPRKPRTALASHNHSPQHSQDFVGNRSSSPSTAWRSSTPDMLKRSVTPRLDDGIGRIGLGENSFSARLIGGDRRSSMGLHNGPPTPTLASTKAASLQALKSQQAVSDDDGDDEQTEDDSDGTLGGSITSVD